MTELKRVLGLPSAVSIVIGTVIGSGIFLVPRTMVQNVGSVEWVFAVWIVGGLLSLAGALTYAELAAMMPEAGGEYVYLNEAYGPVWGYLYGWTQMWVAKSGSIATLATGFFYYLANFWPGLEQVWVRVPGIGESGTPLEIRAGQFFAMFLILGLALLNYCGVKAGGNVQVTVTAAKIVLIGFVIVAGLFFAPAHAAAAATPVVSITLAGFVAALVAALWAYDGWNNVGMVASEVKDPRRNLPLSLIWGTVAVIAIYIAANFAYFHVLTPAEVAASNRVAAEMMRRVLGAPGANAVSIAAMISIFAALNGSILTGSRVPYAMARDGLFFRSFSRVDPTFRTPGVSILGLSAWAAIVVLSGRYDQLLTFVIFASWLLYGMTTAAVFVLRRKQPDTPRPYRTLGYPVVPALFVIAALLIEVITLVHSPRESLLGIALILAGLPFYFVWKRRQPGVIGKIP
ncbi:MAG: amino acid permease [Acidobacteriota bacterium]|nr:amino acid permease [Acidobacteriota bacterium]